MSWKYTVAANNEWAYLVAANNEWKYQIASGSQTYLQDHDGVFILDHNGNKIPI